MAQEWSDSAGDARLAANELSLQSGAVVVTCTWRNQYDGRTGVGVPIPQTNEVGQFYFSSASNAEVFVKVLDFGSERPYLLFWGGLTDLEYTLAYRQTQTGQTVTFQKDAGSACGGVNTTSLNHASAPPPPSEVTVTLPGGVPLVMVRIPAGTFQMGSPTSERNRFDGEILHQVSVTSDYYVGKYEVTQGQWRALMGTNPSAFPGCGNDCPVESVSWNDIRGAGGFLEKLNAHLSATGQTVAGRYRLPTEAEWERAARGGTQTRFSFGEALDGDDGCGANAQAEPYMWWCANSASTTHAVGSKQANPYGLFDVHGNVWEWCEDWHGSYSTTAQTDPTGPATGLSRVWRGGSWGYDVRACRSAMRFDYDPGNRNDVGFRLAASQTPDPSPATDADGYVYRTVRIGNQVWLAENLRARRGVGGDALPDARAYGNNESNVATYGRLYSFTTARMPIIAGWHLPTYDEWTTLISAVGTSNAGELLMLGGSSGFNAVLGGYGDYYGGFRELGIWGDYWTATVMDVVPADHAHIVHFQQGQPQAGRNGAGFTGGNSVRLIKDY